MDKLTHYRALVEAVIKDRAGHKVSHGQIDTQGIVDRERDHYAVVHVGWDRGKRVFGTVLQLDIINGKIWVQFEGSDRAAAEDLVAAGVPHEDIVLGFQPPDIRKYTDFAVA